MSPFFFLLVSLFFLPLCCGEGVWGSLSLPNVKKKMYYVLLFWTYRTYYEGIAFFNVYLWLQDIFVFYFVAAFFSVTIEGEIHKHIYTHASGHTQTLMFHTLIKKFLLWVVSFSRTHVHVRWQHDNDYLPADGMLATLLWIECFPFPFPCSEWCVHFSCSYIFDALCFMP